MIKTKGAGNREYTPRTGEFKKEIEDRFKKLEVTAKEYKERIANQSGISIQSVRKWFREKLYVQDEIEMAAWEELAKAKIDFETKEQSRITRLNKLQ
jgi:intergrase/recombinase